MAKSHPPLNIANVLTLDAFGEMLDFDERMKKEVYMELDGIKLYYEDVCEMFTPLDTPTTAQLKITSNVEEIGRTV